MDFNEMRIQFYNAILLLIENKLNDDFFRLRLWFILNIW